jgi:hypothetical protein
MEITLPVIHLNGTSASMLAREYSEAGVAVLNAIETLSKVEFHSRDYYVAPGTWEKARAEQQERFRQLHQIKEELFAISAHAQEHIKS